MSHYQGTINWNTVKANGVQFVYIKATEGTGQSGRQTAETLCSQRPSRLPGPAVLCCEWSRSLDSIITHAEQNYDGATNVGILRGGYHFAHPDESSGATQANYFLAHGGGWTSDGRTLPGALDIECTYGLPHVQHAAHEVALDGPSAECYGLSQSAMVSWIKDFSNTYHTKTGV